MPKSYWADPDGFDDAEVAFATDPHDPSREPSGPDAVVEAERDVVFVADTHPDAALGDDDVSWDDGDAFG